ncbi:MAG: TOMM precursor leader peptide-binding protein, partial [Atribacterota bacterium]
NNTLLPGRFSFIEEKSKVAKHKDKINLIKKYYNKNSCFTNVSFDTLDMEKIFLKENLNEADLVISSFDSPDNMFNRELNKKTYSINKKITYAESDWFGGRIGPTVIPGENACFECFYQRMRSNHDTVKYFDFYEKNKKSDEMRHTLANTYKILANYTALEVMKILTGYLYPDTYKGVYEFDFMDNREEKHHVLRMPYCEVCGDINVKTIKKIKREE